MNNEEGNKSGWLPIILFTIIGVIAYIIVLVT